MLPERKEIATVVVCEDDEATLELLCDHLTADRFEVLPAPCASDALRLASYNQPDLMVLDLGLPDAGGLDVLREIREADGVAARFDPSLPVIVVSGRGTGEDRVRGFDSGADDYLVKPVHYPELRSRIVAILRRRRNGRHGPCRVGEILIDPARRTVRVGDREVELSNKEFSLLRALARTRPGSSPRRSCSATSGAIAPWGAPGRWTRTPAGCGASSTPSRAASSSTAGASDTG